MYNLAIRKCTSPPLLPARFKIFKWKFTTPPGIELRTCSTRGRHATIWASAASFILIENLSFDNMEKFKYMWVTVMNTNDIREEIKRRINTGNSCYYSLQKNLSSLLLSKKLNINTRSKTIILPVAVCGSESWSLTLRDENRLRVFENKIFRTVANSPIHRVYRQYTKFRWTQNIDEICFFAKESIKIFNVYPTKCYKDYFA